MATPVGRDVGKGLESVRNAVVDLLLVWVCFVVGLADTLCNNLWEALLVAGVFAVGALHSCSVFEELST